MTIPSNLCIIHFVISSGKLFLLSCFLLFTSIWGRSSAGSEKHSETHPTKNLINKLLSVPFLWGRSSAGSPKHSETHPTKNLINKLLSVPFYGGVAQLGERLNGIQEVKSSILSVSTNSTLSNYFFVHFLWRVAIFMPSHMFLRSGAITIILFFQHL